MSDATWPAPWKPRSAELRGGRRTWLVKLLLGVIALVLTIALTATSVRAIDAPNSSAASEPVVELSTAEADSVLDLIDDQELRIRLLEIDLEETRRLAAIDSTLAATRLELTREAYEEIIQAYKDDRDNWLERMAKKPVVWLAIGLYLGVQAD